MAKVPLRFWYGFELSLLFSLFRLGIKKMKNRKAKEPAEAMSGAGAAIASTPPSPTAVESVRLQQVPRPRRRLRVRP
jgi:hypothetical protein